MTHRSYSVGTAAVNKLMSYNTIIQNISREKLIPESFYDNLGWRTFLPFATSRTKKGKTYVHSPAQLLLSTISGGLIPSSKDRKDILKIGYKGEKGDAKFPPSFAVRH